MTNALQRIAESFAPLLAHTEVSPLPFGRFDVVVTCLPWMDAAAIEAVVSLGLFACCPEVGFRVRVSRMSWAEFAARVLFVAVPVGCLLLMTYGGC